MTEQDIQTVARIVVNQNCAMLEARQRALGNLIVATEDKELKQTLGLDLSITRAQLEQYVSARRDPTKQG